MTDHELGTILNSIETAEDEKELRAMLDAIEERNKQLAKKNTKKEARVVAMSALFIEWQNKAEQELEKLFDGFYFGSDSMYIKITAENMAKYLERRGYKVERPTNSSEEPNLDNFYFTFAELNFYEMYLDGINDVVIPLEL